MNTNIFAHTAVENGLLRVGIAQEEVNVILKETPGKPSSNVIRKCTVCDSEIKVISYSWKYPDGTKFTYDMRCQKHLRKFDKPVASDKQHRNALCSCGSGKKFKKCCMGKEVINDKG